MSAKTSRKRLSLCIVEYIGVVGVVDVVGVAVRALFGCMCVVVVEGGEGEERSVGEGNERDIMVVRKEERGVGVRR